MDYFPWPADDGDLIKISVHTGNSSINMHKHDFIEIVFVAHGSCLHKYYDHELILIPGDVFVVVPHEAHSYSINSRTVIYNCLFYPEALENDWNHLEEIPEINNLLRLEPFLRTTQQKQEILHLSLSEGSYIEVVLKKMIDEQNTKCSDFKFVQKSYLLLLISMMGRSWNHQFRESEFYSSGKRNVLAEVICHIEKNYSEELDVRQLASKAYMSPNYFCKIFKEITGLSPMEYINRIRISKSTMLLKGGNLTITKVAEMVGINDTNYFSRMFRAKLGCTPSEYRKASEKC